MFGLGFIIASFLFVTPQGLNIREKLAQTVIVTQHRELAWIFIGAQNRDKMVADLIARNEERGKDDLKFGMIQIKHKNLSADELIKVEDISGPRWKGKKMYVYDPKSIRVVVPSKPKEGERISSMVERTGALAGINGGGFDDPDGLGNGFAPIGFIVSGGDLLYSGYQGYFPQHVVGFDEDGFMIVGKYSTNTLKTRHVTEAVSFYPRIIANGERLIKSGDGGSGIQPRTAIGQKADGTIIMIVIDGRQAHSVGATEKEVQELFMAEGVINAGFLDGGASSELVLKDGGLVTKPSSRYGERRLPSALLVFEHPEDYEATHVWDGMTTIDPGGAYDHPEYLAEQAAKKAKRKAQNNN
ncbi:phosphodiester glycosidase family protein [Paenibacillus psychroresistens]|uniref:Phosphodiester glycosidase family protein n=1 Tax=Paenibacillus psychroresistens TaxID=1778678 RepID=A0A6B8RY56_9BACL|nr:phosphodiester glycosidase family protein [Paenibacillus psychroresistens]